jgi:hypothetical protein
MPVDYVCHRSSRPVPVDGRLADPIWSRVPRSPRFVDMVSGEPGFFDTRAAAVWDDECLHVGFWCEEPFPDARVTERDGIVFAESDVELFIDGGDCYYELELNAANTVYEVLFVWKRRRPSGAVRIRAARDGPSSTGTCPGCARRCTSTAR